LQYEYEIEIRYKDVESNSFTILRQMIWSDELNLLRSFHLERRFEPMQLVIYWNACVWACICVLEI